MSTLLGLLLSLAVWSQDGAPPAIAFENGRWFDGEEFVLGTRWSVDGVLREAKPEHVDLTLDLDGQWVVPPYGDAHTHLLEPDLAKEYGALWLRRGVFYARDQGNTLGIRRRLEEHYNRPDTLEFVSPNQGFTGPGGHPLQVLAQMQHVLGSLPKEWGPEEFHGEALFIVTDEAGIDAAWPAYLEGGPDFLKLFLLYTEAWEERRDDDAYLYRRGLDPALAKPLVDRAHAAGLEVSAHVYTRGDFRVAVDAGADLVAHFPGIGYEPELGDEAFLLTAEDARRAGERGVVVVTTLSDSASGPGPISPATRAYFDRIIVPNLDLLVSAGVQLLVGSDQVRVTSDVEALTLHRLELFDPLTLLKLWCEDTPRSIFPDRKIGRLADGFETSFLVLEGDPLEDFENTQRIALRVKSGHLLFPREPVFPPLGR